MKLETTCLICLTLILFGTSTVHAEIVCTRDYGGELVIGECFYLKNGEYLKSSSAIQFQWSGGWGGGYVLNANQIDEPFSLALKPYIVSQSNKVYDLPTILSMYPGIMPSQYVIKRDNYKWGLDIMAIPSGVQYSIKYVAFMLEDSKGINYQDIEIQANRNRVILKNEIVLDYNDLIQAGFTVQLYNKTTILIGNVQGKENLFLDPTIQLKSDTYSIDTFVDAGSADTNYGTDTYIRFDSRNPNRGYIRYNTTNVSGQTILDARLYLYHNTYDYSNTVQMVGYEVYNHSWTESGITWNNQVCGAGFDISANCNLTQFDNYTDTDDYTWYSLNVTQAVKNQLSDGVLDIALKPSIDGLYIAYYASSEYGTTANRHYLNITYSSGTTSTTSTSTSSTVTSTTSTSTSSTSTTTTTSTTSTVEATTTTSSTTSSTGPTTTTSSTTSTTLSRNLNNFQTLYIQHNDTMTDINITVENITGSIIHYQEFTGINSLSATIELAPFAWWINEPVWYNVRNYTNYIIKEDTKGWFGRSDTQNTYFKGNLNITGNLYISGCIIHSIDDTPVTIGTCI